MDKWNLYQHMYYSRVFEEIVVRLWNQGKIFGEMHTGIGEEAIMAGIVSQIHDGDALALDHRGTSPLLIRGCDPVLLLKEFLGHADGLCGGMGGHMHLFSKDLLAASSGIVGASGPSAVGFALAIKTNKKNNIVICFFGEGAMNQGMMMESLNLAAIWNLPILFVCKDNDISITTKSSNVSAGNLAKRAESFGITAEEIDGTDVEKVWKYAQKTINDLRAGKGPFFLHAHCVHFEGHFLGDPILRQVRKPWKELKSRTGPLFKSLSKKIGADFKNRLKGLEEIYSIFSQTLKKELSRKNDPVYLMRLKLLSEKSRLLKLENEIKDILDTSLKKSVKQ